MIEKIVKNKGGSYKIGSTEVFMLWAVLLNLIDISAGVGHELKNLVSFVT